MTASYTPETRTGAATTATTDMSIRTPFSHRQRQPPPATPLDADQHDRDEHSPAGDAVRQEPRLACGERPARDVDRPAAEHPPDGSQRQEQLGQPRPEPARPHELGRPRPGLVGEAGEAAPQRQSCRARPIGQARGGPKLRCVVGGVRVSEGPVVVLGLLEEVRLQPVGEVVEMRANSGGERRDFVLQGGRGHHRSPIVGRAVRFCGWSSNSDMAAANDVQVSFWRASISRPAALIA